MELQNTRQFVQKDNEALTKEKLFLLQELKQIKESYQNREDDLQAMQHACQNLQNEHKQVRREKDLLTQQID